MPKFYNEDYELVEAFTQEELDAKLKEAVKAAEEAAEAKIKEAETKAAAAEAEKAKVDEKLTKRSEEYNNLKTKFEETGGKIKTVEEERQNAYKKMLDSNIKKLAGDDKEYEEQLRSQYERVGKETLDPTEMEKFLKDSHTLALSELNRDFTPFSMANNSGGEPPKRTSDGETKNFTETDEGKATLDAALSSMGMKPVTQDKDNI